VAAAGIAVYLYSKDNGWGQEFEAGGVSKWSGFNEKRNSNRL